MLPRAMLFHRYLPVFIVGLISLFLMNPAHAHDDHDHGHNHGHDHDRPGLHKQAGSEEEELRKYMEILQATTSLAPKMLDPESPSSSLAWVMVGGQKVYFNSHFWELVRQVAALYHQELASDCHGCPMPTTQDIMGVARDYIAKGWWTDRASRLGNLVVDRYGRALIELGARYGLVAGVLKLVGELVEDALLVVFKMPGAHFLCDAITTVLTLVARRVQIGYRALSMDSPPDFSGLMSFLKINYIARKIHKAQKKVIFESLPFEINHDELEKLNEWGITRKKFFIHLDHDNRKNFVQWLHSKVAPIHRQLEEKNLTERKRKRLQKSLNSYQSLKQKITEGHRYKRFLLLFSRKSHSRNLSGSTSLDKYLRGGHLWVLSTEVNVLDPSLIPHRENGRLSSEGQRLVKEFETNYESFQMEPIRYSLAKTFSEQISSSHVEQVDKILADIERIFDPSVSVSQKYLNLVSLEALIGGFIYKIFRKVNDRSWNKLLKDDPSTGFSRFKTKTKYWWKMGSLPKHIDPFFDFLRLVAVNSPNGDTYWLKYQAMEYLLEIFNSLSLLEAQDNLAFTSPQQMLNQLDKRMNKLESMQFWKPKRRVFHWLPFLPHRAPRCEELAEI